MMTLETTQTVPLESWEDGTIRVCGTRLLIDLVVDAHNRGLCPEDIYDSFPSKYYTVGDIYSVIAYYLSHKASIDKHLADRSKQADKDWKKIETDPNHIELLNKLRTRKHEYLAKNGTR